MLNIRGGILYLQAPSSLPPLGDLSEALKWWTVKGRSSKKLWFSIFLESLDWLPSYYGDQGESMATINKPMSKANRRLLSQRSKIG